MLFGRRLATYGRGEVGQPPWRQSRPQAEERAADEELDASLDATGEELFVFERVGEDLERQHFSAAGKQKVSECVDGVVVDMAVWPADADRGVDVGGQLEGHLDIDYV